MEIPKPIIKENSGSGMFLKIQSGQKVTGVLRGSVHTFFVRWERESAGGKWRSYPCEPSHPRSSPRYKVNIIVIENRKPVAKIWEFDTTVCTQLDIVNSRLKMKNRSLETTMLDITRIDKKLYDIKEQDSTMNPQQIAAVESVELKILDGTKPKPVKENIDEQFSDDLPF